MRPQLKSLSREFGEFGGSCSRAQTGKVNLLLLRDVSEYSLSQFSKAATPLRVALRQLVEFEDHDFRFVLLLVKLYRVDWQVGNVANGWVDEVLLSRVMKRKQIG